MKEVQSSYKSSFEKNKVVVPELLDELISTLIFNFIPESRVATEVQFDRFSGAFWSFVKPPLIIKVEPHGISDVQHVLNSLDGEEQVRKCDIIIRVVKKTKTMEIPEFLLELELRDRSILYKFTECDNFQTLNSTLNHSIVKQYIYSLLLDVYNPLSALKKD
jgi:hypothetical protein